MNKKLRDNKKFFDGWAYSYDYPLFQFWMRKFYQPALRKITNHGKVLDVSCGTGEFLRELKAKKKNSLYGVDFSSEMLAVAKKKLGTNAHLQKADVHHLPFPANTFDDVVSTEAFHHYYDQKKALREMKRVTKNGGKVMVVDLNFFLRPIHQLFEKLEPGCVRIHHKKEMKNLFKEVGLRNIMQERSFFFAVLTQGMKS